MFVFRKPEEWAVSWGGSGTIFGWGHNHRGQLGGVEGAKVKLPTTCESVTNLRPLQIVGGEQTLFVVTTEMKVCFAFLFFALQSRTLTFDLNFNQTLASKNFWKNFNVHNPN